MAASEQVARRLARRIAQQFKLDPDVFEAQINQESGFRAGAVSPKGASGIAQFIPSTAKAYGVNLGDGRIRDDLVGAAKYMRDNLERAGGDYRKALSIYNSGRPDGYKRFSETSNYVRKIMAAAGGADEYRGGGDEKDTDREISSQSEPETVTETRQVTDTQGLATARRRAVLGQMVAKRDPTSPLVKFGVLSPAEPDPAAFTRTETVERTVRSDGAGNEPREGGRPQSSGGRSKLLSGDLGEAMRTLDWISRVHGTPITAKQEPGHQPGGDHDPAVAGASARDTGGPTEARAAAYRAILRRLGLDPSKSPHEGRDVNITKNGLRFQIITRPHGSGPHNHVGVREA